MAGSRLWFRSAPFLRTNCACLAPQRSKHLSAVRLTPGPHLRCRPSLRAAARALATALGCMSMPKTFQESILDGSCAAAARVFVSPGMSTHRPPEPPNEAPLRSRAAESLATPRAKLPKPQPASTTRRCRQSRCCSASRMASCSAGLSGSGRSSGGGGGSRQAARASKAVTTGKAGCTFSNRSASTICRSICTRILSFR